jgi:uncharacterized damage-inducible protein DinB
MKYDFLVESYASERVKVLSVWSEFRDEDLAVRPRADDPRRRSVHEHMVHQCVSEDAWFRTMLGIAVTPLPLPPRECRLEFMKRYAEDSTSRLAILRETDEDWWEAQTTFFDVKRSKAWVMTRHLNHTSHRRGQQMAMLRMLGRELHSDDGLLSAEVVGGASLEAALAAYEDAGIRGLCAEGRWEAALAAIHHADLAGVRAPDR